jgi:hypothetical protein
MKTGGLNGRLTRLERLLAPALQCAVAGNPVPKLCLCDPCCGDPGDRWFARRSHGINAPPGAP